MFNKRHYQAIAQAMQDAKCNQPDEARRGIDRAINVLADLFGRDSGQFQRDRFERACVPGANVRARG